jgi:hypothetical protein
MVLKRVCQFAFCASLLVWAGSTSADEYRPDEFFGLDLSQAVLSPKRLGPPTEFAPVAVEARADPKAERKILVRTTRVLARNVVRTARAVPKHIVRTARVAPKNVVRTARVVPKPNVIAAKPRVAARHVVAAKPRVTARTNIARRHTNPLDAQAMDARIQVWPCRSGGICDWKR